MFLRDLLVRVPRAARVDLSGRHYVVTGTAAGSLGYATARTLAAWGAAVFVSTRRDTAAVVAQMREDLQAAGLPHAVAGHELELCDAACVRAFADAARGAQGGRLDALINNAGIHLDLLSEWKTAHLSADGHEIHWRTNYLGTMQLTHALLPALLDTARQHGEARIVNLVSMLHARGRNTDLFGAVRPYHSWDAYGNSKLALVHATFELQRRHGDAGLRAYCLHPGAVHTNIATRGLAGKAALLRLRRVMAPVEAFFLLTPEEGVQGVLLCATAPGLAGGRYFRDGKAAAPSREASNTDVARRLWDATLTTLAGWR